MKRIILLAAAVLLLPKTSAALEPVQILEVVANLDTQRDAFDVMVRLDRPIDKLTESLRIGGQYAENKPFHVSNGWRTDVSVLPPEWVRPWHGPQEDFWFFRYGPPLYDIRRHDVTEIADGDSFIYSTTLDPDEIGLRGPQTWGILFDNQLFLETRIMFKQDGRLKSVVDYAPSGIDGDFSILYIPEPSTIALAGIGVVALVAHRWRRLRSGYTSRSAT